MVMTGAKVSVNGLEQGTAACWTSHAVGQVCQPLKWDRTSIVIENVKPAGDQPWNNCYTVVIVPCLHICPSVLWQFCHFLN